jgi:hypothetical protein
LQLASTVAEPRGQPRNYIVPQQISVRVAIRYRADWAIGKFGTVRRNRGRNAPCLPGARFHAAGNCGMPPAGLIDQADAEETAELK